MKKIVSILGTRPEIVKFSPLFDRMSGDFESVVIHTGQHYSFELDKLFFKQLKLPPPTYNLEVGSGNQTRQLAKIVMSTGEKLLKEKPDLVLVLGDTNSTLGGTLAAKKLNLLVGHIEAGCRSFNRKMQEEINRIATDSISDYLFAPDDIALKNLLKEGIERQKITVVGSTSLEASKRNLPYAERVEYPENLSPLPTDYVLTTIHRAETTDNKKRLSQIIESLNFLSEKIAIIFPIHPRTKKMVKRFNIDLRKEIKISKPLGYLEFLKLMKNAEFIISDSGGIQEEAAVFNVPCFIPRKETEWKYLVDAGKNLLIGIETGEIICKVLPFIENKNKLKEIKNRSISLDYAASGKILKRLHEIVG